jgi:hypothetical protein
MPDYGRAIEFGFFLVPNADEYPQLIEQAELADRLGLEYVGVQDHPYQSSFLETFALLAVLALNDGLDTFIFWPREAPGEQLRRFAEDVAPVVRATVERERTG